MSLLDTVFRRANGYQVVILGTVITTRKLISQVMESSQMGFEILVPLTEGSVTSGE